MPSVVVAVDGAERTSDALALGALVAAPLGAEVIAVSIHPRSPPSGQGGNAYARILRREAVAALDAAEKLGVERIRLLSSDDPAQALRELAQEVGAELIVLGSSAAQDGHAAPGGLAKRLLHGSDCPVVISPVGFHHRNARIKRVGVAFNGTREAEAALRFAVRMATGAQASLSLWHVVDTSIIGEIGSWVTLRETLHQFAADDLAAAERSLRDDIEVDTHLLDGSPVDALKRSAAAVDLVVVGSRGYGPLRRVLVGAVSLGLIRACRFPVVVVPRPAAHGDEE